MEQEKKEYLEQMQPWFKKPMTLPGIIVMVLIMTVEGGLGFRSRRLERKIQEEKEEERIEEKVGHGMQKWEGQRDEQEKSAMEDRPVNV